MGKVAGMIRAAPLAFLALPAMAQESVTFDAAGESYVLIEAHPEAAAVVTYRNALIPGTGDATGTVWLGDLGVEFHIAVLPGALPETITIDPPEGFIAIPPVAVVEEDEEVHILIVNLSEAGIM
jgi:hypothetical protein